MGLLDIINKATPSAPIKKEGGWMCLRCGKVEKEEWCYCPWCGQRLKEKRKG